MIKEERKCHKETELVQEVISAKLFCKRSQVTFMPYGIVLKDVRCSFFSVNLPQSIRCKNNLALMVQEVKAQQQVEAWDEAAAVAADLAALPQALVETAFAQAVENGAPTKLEPLALIYNAPSAGPHHGIRVRLPE